MLAQILVIVFLVFLLLVVFGCFAITIDDLDHFREDQEQIEYIKKWRETHKK